MTTMHKNPAAPRNRKLSAIERALPPGPRGRLETARLELRALFRAADQVHIAQSVPEERTG